MNSTRVSEKGERIDKGFSKNFLYGGGPPINLLYAIFHDFVDLLLTN